MRTVKFHKDFTFNTHGGKGGRVSKQAGETWRGEDELCDKLVNHWQVASYHDMKPQHTKPATPKEQKLVALNRGGGWYDVFDSEGNEVDPNIHGKEKLQDKYPNIEITSA